MINPFKQIDQFQIIESLGQGGMAVVYKALDTRLERVVALKMLSPGQSLSKDATRRFNAEIKILARLSHPNIIKVFSYGKYDGRPYLVMEFMEGGTLKSRMGNQVPWQQAAQWLAPIARALENAHQHGIVHRDVKPTNILFNKNDLPVLSDFGIAWHGEGEETQDLVETGSIGTPQYMSPEQGLGRSANAGSDIFSLGAILYELVTGQRPFNGETPLEILYNQTHKPLIGPGTYVKDLPKGVERIIDTALTLNPKNRYGTMGDFAKELESLAQGIVKPGYFQIPHSPPGRIKKPLMIFALFGILLLVIGLTLGQYLSRFSKASPNTMPPSQPVSTESGETLETAAQPVAIPTMSETIQPAAATQIPLSETRVVSLSIGVENISQLHKVASLSGFTSPVSSVVFSSDGKSFAAGSFDKTIQLWQIDTLNQTLKINVPDVVDDLSLSTDGTLVTSLTRTKGVWLWSLTDGRLIQAFTGQATCMAISEIGDYLAAGFSDWSIHIWQLTGCETNSSECGRQVGEYSQTAPVTDVAFNTNREAIVSTSENGFRMWQLSSGKLLEHYEAPNSPLGSFLYSPNGDVLANINFSDSINEQGILNHGTLDLLRPMNYSVFHKLTTDKIIYQTVFNPSGKLIAAAGGGSLYFWNVDTGDLAYSIGCIADGQCVSLAFSPDGNNLVVGTDRGIVQLWQIKP